MPLAGGDDETADPRVRRLGDACARAHSAMGDATMNTQYIVGGVVALLLTVYLIYALLWPERF